MANFSKFFNNKKVLQVGLGQLGGGLAMAKFLCENDAQLTVTDAKNKEELEKSISELAEYQIKYSLGGHKETDFKSNDMIVFNQAVSIFTPWAKLALGLNKEIYNNYTLFLKLTEDLHRPIIATTGTRGKTTTTAWLSHLIEGSITGGNTPDADLFKIILRDAPEKSPFVIEVPSFQLEFADKNTRPSKISLITNLYADHLNRYDNMQTYAKIKAKIFQNQTDKNILILNADNDYTNFFLSQKPRAQVYFFSARPLPDGKKGAYCQDNKIIFSNGANSQVIADITTLSKHEKENLMAATLGAYLFGIPAETINKKTANLPSVPLRQQVVKHTDEWLVINDSASTSPDATIAAIEKFRKNERELFLICGGTDKNLNFSVLAKKIKETLPEENIFLLAGSATDKLIAKLSKLEYFKNSPRQFDSLEEIFNGVKMNPARQKTIIFSPGAASFGKFKNEFDRGKKFNDLIKTL